jgi:predicted nucleic acid-binding protein
VSFELMRRWGISIALALDRHFAPAGFTVVPA